MFNLFGEITQVSVKSGEGTENTQTDPQLTASERNTVESFLLHEVYSSSCDLKRLKFQLCETKF